MQSSSERNQRSIAQVNRMIRSVLEAETLEQYFWVGGKVERYHRSERGHVYFTLVDGPSRIRCMIRDDRLGHIPLELRNGLEIEIYGDVHFYERAGSVEINVQQARAVSKKSDGRSAVEVLKAEGLYPPEKREPPTRIRRIGIVTSRSSRAIGDFESSYRTAGEGLSLPPYDLHYVLLEGERAPQSIADAIEKLHKSPQYDALAIIRGGGRHENLSPFDDVLVARAIALCSQFVVTGIGHHSDATLADDVADYAASTPTAAAHYFAQLSRGASRIIGESENAEVGRVAVSIRVRLLVAVLLLILVLAAAYLVIMGGGGWLPQ